MTKDDVMKFLDTASTEVFSEIRARMTQIVRDRNFQEHLAKNGAKRDRIERICEMKKSGMTFDQIGEVFNISTGRCRQIHAREMHLMKYRSKA